MNDQQLHKKIEAYLLHQMSPDEKAAFESAIKADPKLAERVELQQLSLKIVSRLGEMDMRKKFEQWRAEDESDKIVYVSKNSLPFYRNWLVLTLAIVFLAAAFWFGRSCEKSQPEIEQPLKKQLIDTASTKQPLEQNIVSIPTPPANDNTQRIHRLAENKLNDYGSKAFGDYLRGEENKETPEMALFLKADSLLSSNNYKAAVGLLEKIGPKSPYITSATKRLAFSYYKLAQYDLAVFKYMEYEALTPSNQDENDWALCLYCLADYPNHKMLLNQKLRTMLENKKHDYHENAVALKRDINF